jgi:hypothetical protein
MKPHQKNVKNQKKKSKEKWNVINDFFFLDMVYPVHVGLNISGANRTHLALTFV